MKKIILFLGILFLLFAIGTYAKEFTKVKVSSFLVEAEVFPQGGIKKIVDGMNVCYTYQTTISCLKK